MRTNIEIDDELMKEAMKVTGAATKKAAVEEALQLFVSIRGQAGIRKLRGKVQFEDDVMADRIANSLEQRPVAKKGA